LRDGINEETTRDSINEETTRDGINEERPRETTSTSMRDGISIRDGINKENQDRQVSMRDSINMPQMSNATIFPLSTSSVSS